jgi:hypothetical protein
MHQFVKNSQAKANFTEQSYEIFVINIIVRASVQLAARLVKDKYFNVRLLVK